MVALDRDVHDAESLAQCRGDRRIAQRLVQLATSHVADGRIDAQDDVQGLTRLDHRSLLVPRAGTGALRLASGTRALPPWRKSCSWTCRLRPRFDARCGEAGGAGGAGVAASFSDADADMGGAGGGDVEAVAGEIGEAGVDGLDLAAGDAARGERGAADNDSRASRVVAISGGLCRRAGRCRCPLRCCHSCAGRARAPLLPRRPPRHVAPA